MKLMRATYVSEGEGGAEGETARADEVMVYGAEGSGSSAPERLEARGAVVLTAGGRTITGNEGSMLLSDGTHPQRARVSGAVTFQAEDGGRLMQGSATEGEGRFDRAGRMEEVDLTGLVKIHEAEHGTAGESTERELSSGKLAMHLSTTAEGRQWLREAEAETGARMVTTTIGGRARAGAKAEAAASASEMRGDRLKAWFALSGGQTRMERVEGAGHTVLRRVGAQGEDTSSGETLEVKFKAAPKAAGEGMGGREEIATAVQEGAVTMTHVGTEAGATAEHATGDRAMYEGETERTTLTGRVRLAFKWPRQRREPGLQPSRTVLPR